MCNVVKSASLSNTSLYLSFFLEMDPRFASVFPPLGRQSSSRSPPEKASTPVNQDFRK